MRVFVVRSWQLAADTERFLEWIWSADRSPQVFRLIDQDTRDRWKQFLENLEKEKGEPITVNMEVVRAYLHIRHRGLEALRDDIDNARP